LRKNNYTSKTIQLFCSKGCCYDD